MQETINNVIALRFYVLMTVAVSAAGASFPAERIVLANINLEGAAADQVTYWQDQVRRGDRDPWLCFDQLGWALVNVGRRHSDAGYFKLAELAADAMDAQRGSTSESALLRGHSWLQQHRFAETEALAKRLVAQQDEPKAYALLADATMERGNLKEAVAACQRLVDLQPDMAAFVRIAQLRWLHGDLPGAIEAMSEAERTVRGSFTETTAWTRVRLGHFQLLVGNLIPARAWAESVLAVYPDYAPAWLLRGRVDLALGHVVAAVEALDRAAALNPLPHTQWWQLEALRTAGESARAEEVARLIRSHGPAADPRTTALFLASSNIDPKNAVRLARSELEHRADAHTYDALGWAQFAVGDFAAAADSMTKALEAGLSDGPVWLHAGIIFEANNEPKEAAVYLARAQEFASSLMPSERDRLAAAFAAVD